MTKRQLLWGATWRGALMGLIAGVLLGGGYGFIFGFGWGGIYISFIAGPVGFILGIIGGIIFGTVTALFFFPPRDSKLYRLILSIIAVTLGVVGNVTVENFILGGLLPNWISKMADPATIWLIVAPSFIAGVAALYLSQRLAGWYEKEMQNSNATNIQSGSINQQS